VGGGEDLFPQDRERGCSDSRYSNTNLDSETDAFDSIADDFDAFVEKLTRKRENLSQGSAGQKPSGRKPSDHKPTDHKRKPSKSSSPIPVPNPNLLRNPNRHAIHYIINAHHLEELDFALDNLWETFNKAHDYPVLYNCYLLQKPFKMSEPEPIHCSKYRSKWVDITSMTYNAFPYYIPTAI
jgi:hypothetical protein